MAKELVPIKVVIRLKIDGHADYPDFNQIDGETRKGLDWSHYIDVYGTGWLYDQVSGLKDDHPGSPIGTQFGVLLVPKDFAVEALELFSDRVSELTVEELEDFHDNRVTLHEPEELLDVGILSAIKLKKELDLPLTEEQQRALDPEDPTPGIVKNRMKSWKDKAESKGIVIVRAT